MQEEDRHITNLLQNLDDRNKELNCLYQLDEILTDIDSPLEIILDKLPAVISSGWRYPDICKVKINCDEIEIISEGYKKTDLQQTAKIVTEGKEIGSIQICYIKPLRMEKGVFLFEETRLLKTIAEKIGKFILYKRLRNSIEELKKSSNKINTENESVEVQNWLSELSLTSAEIEQITSVKINFKKGETICKQGAISSFIMLLAEGLSKNYLEGNQDKGFNFSIIRPFDFIGLSSLFGTDVYHFSGAALTPCQVYLIDRELFKRIVASNTKFAEEIMKWYCRITEGHLKRMSAMANKQAHGKIADVLIYLSEKIFQDSMIETLISRKDIAELAGMSTESAVRILSDMNKDKIIQIQQKGIQILNVKLLETLSRVG